MWLATPPLFFYIHSIRYELLPIHYYTSSEYVFEDSIHMIRKKLLICLRVHCHIISSSSHSNSTPFFNIYCPVWWISREFHRVDLIDDSHSNSASSQRYSSNSEKQQSSVVAWCSSEVSWQTAHSRSARGQSSYRLTIQTAILHVKGFINKWHIPQSTWCHHH